MKATDVEIERRCGMVTGASCGHVTLSWIPGDGRNGTRSWVRGMKDGRFIDADPLIILKADNHQGSDRWDVYVSKTVYPTAESYGTLAGVPRMLADDVEVEIMAREKEMGGGQ